MTAKGKIVFTLLFLAVIGFGVWKWWDKLPPKRVPSGAALTSSSAAPTNNSAASATVQAPELAELETEVATLPAPLTYQPKNNPVDVELSEYAGYAGFIAANGGLAPNENSV